MFPEFSLPRTSVEVLTHADGRYHLQLAWPQEPPPDTGYPIVYLLDAEIGFGTMVESIRQRSRRPDATGVPPSVVAGISLVVDRPEDKARRTFDFTPQGLEPPAGEWPRGAAPATGGAEAFLGWLTTAVRQRAEHGRAIDAGRRTIFGHSLGGLFVLHALSAAPAAFRTFVAASPSIWWDVAGVRARADRLAQAVPPPAPRVLLTAGSHEQTLAPWQSAAVSASSNDVRDRRDRRRMVDHVLDLGQRLSALRTRGGAVEALVFEGEDHASVVPLTINRALRFGPGLID